jgi:hypothetical protein
MNELKRVSMKSVEPSGQSMNLNLQNLLDPVNRSTPRNR